MLTFYTVKFLFSRNFFTVLCSGNFRQNAVIIFQPDGGIIAGVKHDPSFSPFPRLTFTCTESELISFVLALSMNDQNVQYLKHRENYLANFSSLSRLVDKFG